LFKKLAQNKTGTIKPINIGK